MVIRQNSQLVASSDKLSHLYKAISVGIKDTIQQICLIKCDVIHSWHNKPLELLFANICNHQASLCHEHMSPNTELQTCTGWQTGNLPRSSWQVSSLAKCAELLLGSCVVNWLQKSDSGKSVLGLSQEQSAILCPHRQLWSFVDVHSLPQSCQTIDVTVLPLKSKYWSATAGAHEGHNKALDPEPPAALGLFASLGGRHAAYHTCSILLQICVANSCSSIIMS